MLDITQSTWNHPETPGVTYRYADDIDASAVSEMRLQPSAIMFANLVYANEYKDVPELGRVLRLGRALAGLSGRDGTSHNLVASTGGITVGYLRLLIGMGKQNHIAQVDMLVDERNRRLNIGTGLMLTVLDLATTLKVQALETQTRMDNEVGIAFLTAMGFHPNGITSIQDEDRTQYPHIGRRFWRMVNPAFEIWELQHPTSVD